MVSLTENERKALLILFKDFTAYYNANSISKVLGISRVGALMLFRRLKAQGLVASQRIGKSIVYKLNLNDDYVMNLVTFLLADEANSFKRWKAEFNGLFKKGRIVVLFGSVLRNYERANDIDLLVVSKSSDEMISIELKRKAEILPKKLHAIRMNFSELESNIRAKQVAILDVVKTGVVLYGQDEYVEVLRNVTSR
ncbi:MAG: nucleotidyltransferase domain-containing protein [Candidatus Woesearchaeota archaeon]